DLSSRPSADRRPVLPLAGGPAVAVVAARFRPRSGWLERPGPHLHPVRRRRPLSRGPFARRRPGQPRDAGVVPRLARGPATARAGLVRVARRRLGRGGGSLLALADGRFHPLSAAA